MVKTCPHCGAIAEQKIFHSPIKQRIFDYVRTHPDAPLQSIHSAVYAEDPNGGPEPNTVTAHVSCMNRHLRPLGMIITAKRGRNSGYRLVKVNSL